MGGCNHLRCQVGPMNTRGKCTLHITPWTVRSVSGIYTCIPLMEKVEIRVVTQNALEETGTASWVVEFAQPCQPSGRTMLSPAYPTCSGAMKRRGGDENTRQDLSVNFLAQRISTQVRVA